MRITTIKRKDVVDTFVKNNINIEINMIVRNRDGKYELLCDCPLKFKTYNEGSPHCSDIRKYCFNSNLPECKRYIKEEDWYKVQLKCLKLHFPKIYDIVKDNLYFSDYQLEYLKMIEKEEKIRKDKI